MDLLCLQWGHAAPGDLGGEKWFCSEEGAHLKASINSLLGSLWGWLGVKWVPLALLPGPFSLPPMCGSQPLQIWLRGKEKGDAVSRAEAFPLCVLTNREIPV